jgi:16S rRNA (cytidine1402-2'-O)-methyltransferase
VARLRQLRDLGRPIVLYESPHRLAATLRAIEEVFGPVEVVLARELTKQFEEFRRGTPAHLLTDLPPGGVRGEITLIVNAGAAAPEEDELGAPAADGPAAGA